MKEIQIVSVASDICWWIDCVGQICPVLEVHKDTGFLKIRVSKVELAYTHPYYETEGWISPQHVKQL